MKHALPLIAIAALVGCASNAPPQGPSQWGYQQGQAAPTVISEVEAETLTGQYRELKLKREEIASAMAAARDPNVRANYARIIDDLSRNMAPLEYRLRSAGRPIP